MRPPRDNWVRSERVAPKHGEKVWVISPYGLGIVESATYQTTEDEDVPEGFFWELPLVRYAYGHRHWQPRFPNQPQPALPL